MDPDIPHPSIETDDNHVAQSLDISSASSSVRDGGSGQRRSDVLAPASPAPGQTLSTLQSPKRSPMIQRHVAPTQSSPAQNSPARKVTNPSPLRPDRRSSTPLLRNKSSAQSLRNFTPSSPSRRSSTAMSMISADQALPRPPLTAATVAREHFQGDLDAHSTSPTTETVVIIHDACYGHRFSRPRTTKAQLSTIVERPERILAAVLGLSGAYVRLGERHQGGRHAPSPASEDTPTPPFQFRKTSRTLPLSAAAATQVHPAKWMDELKIMCEMAESKLAANGKELTRPEGMDKEFDGTARPKLHEGDLYLCSESLSALEGCLGGICEGVDTVFTVDGTKRAFVCIRPPGHHCSSDFPSGFCWLNNVHVGISHAAMTHGLTHAAIIDFDLHHGDGSQAIAWDHNARATTLPKNAPAHRKVPIGYYSLHDINSYPCEYGDEEKVRNASLCIENAHGQSIWNVHLQPWRTSQDFWNLYETKYMVLLEKARSFLKHHTERLDATTNGPKPKAAIFVSAGFDASEWEGAGMQRHKVNVPTDFYARFTADVVKLSEEEGLGVEGRVISVLEGGYSDRALTSGIMSHVCGLACGGPAASMVAQTKSLEQQMEGLRVESQDVRQLNGHLRLDPDWWAPHHLEALEALAHKGQAPPAPKKAKELTPGNYSSPTTASTARSLSGSHRDRSSFTGEIGAARQLSPKPEAPPPEVDWVTAAVELSRLIIPTDRTTVSCRHDELNAEATRARKARQSAVGAGTTDMATDKEPRMQLRERKAKATAPEAPASRAASKANRRKTIAAVHEIGETPSEEPIDNQGRAASRAQRRVSDASSIISGFSNMQIDEKPPHDASFGQPGPPAEDDKIPAPPRAPVVRKSRPTATNASRVKSPPNATTSPRRPTAAPSASRVPSNHMQHFRKSSQPLSRPGTASHTPVPNVDELTSSVGRLKINLKVPSPEENAAREKVRAQAKDNKDRKPRVQRKPPVPKAAKVNAPKTEITNGTHREPNDIFPTTTPASHTNNGSLDTASMGSAPATQSSVSDTITVPINVPVAQAPTSAVIPAPTQPSPPVLESKPDLASGESTSSVAGTHSDTAPSNTSMAISTLLSPAAPDDTAPSHAYSDTQVVNQDIPGSTFSRNMTNSSVAANENSHLAGMFPPEISQMSKQPSHSDLAEKPTEHQSSSHPTYTTLGSQSSFAPSTSAQPIKHTRADLPIFTSSSPIPFSNGSSSRPSTANSTAPTSIGQLMNLDNTMFKSEPYPGDSYPVDIESANTEQNPRPSEHNQSIWDVPETPRN